MITGKNKTWHNYIAIHNEANRDATNGMNTGSVHEEKQTPAVKTRL